MDSGVPKNSCAVCRLADLCLPYGLHANEVQKLATIVKNKRPLRTDEFLYSQGDEGQSLYAVKSGSFRSFITNSDGLEQTIGFYLPGELMGLDSLQFGRYTCSIVALETGTVCDLPISHLKELCTEIPGLQAQLIRVLGKEITSDHDKILLLGHRSAKARMATFLLMLSLRYAALGFSSTEFNLSMRRHDIANFLGLTIETVSRQLAYLSKQEIISIQQRSVQIKNLALLRSIVEPSQPVPLCSAE